MDPPTSSSAAGITAGSPSQSSNTPSSSGFRLRPSSLSTQVKFAPTDAPGDNPDVKESPLKDVNSLSTNTLASSSRGFLLRPSALRVTSDNQPSPSAPKETEKVTGTAGYPFAPLSSSESSTPALHSHAKPSQLPTLTGTSTSAARDHSENGLPNSSVDVASETVTVKVNGSSSSEVTGQSEGGGFVFGQNLQERVVFSVKAGKSTDEEEKSSPLKESIVPSTSTLSAPDVIAPVLSTSTSPSSSSASKRKYEAITGEEDESNVLQIHCKLYHWEASEMSWKEKGKGFLKLNDKQSGDKLSSRLVMRTAGSLKVILNCSLLTGMNIGKASETQLKFTNIDGIYTVKGKEKDIDLLFSAIDCRLREQAKRVKAAQLSVPPNDGQSTGSSSKDDVSSGRHDCEDDDGDVEDEDNDVIEQTHEDSPVEETRVSVTDTTSCSSTAAVKGEDDTSSVEHIESSQESDHFHTIRETREDSNTNDASNSND